MKQHQTGTSRLEMIVIATIAVTLVVLGIQTARSEGAPPVGSADLSVTKTDAKDPVQPGATIAYTITVTNAGPDTAVNTVVTDRLPKGTTFVSATASKGTCAVKGTTVTCTLGDLTKGGAYDTATVNLLVKAPSTGGTLTNTADVASDTKDPNKANDSATQTTVVAGGNGGGGGASCLGSKVTILGTPAGETLRGTDRRDVIFGAGGADVIKGLGGKDLICGAGGADRIRGGDGDDRLSGAGGKDQVGGQGGDDVVKGGKRADSLRGGAGDDLLRGGQGNDRCSGGSGKDVERGC